METEATSTRTSNMTIRPRNHRGFTLLEMLITIAALTGIMTIAVVSYTGVQTSLKTKKLEQDVAAVNSAVKVYLANGGQMGALVTPQAIINKLKTVPSADNRKEIAGLRGSMIDPQLEVVMQSVEEAESGEPRAHWNAATKSFDVVLEGDPGIKGFRMNKALLLNAPVFDDDRIVSLKLAKTSKWIWDYQEAGGSGTPTFGPVNVGSTSQVPFGLPNTPAGAIQLNPPSFDPVGGTYALTDFESLEVTISDPNPVGASQLFYSLDGTTWQLYLGEVFEVEPDDAIHAISVSLDPDFWEDSDVYVSSYTANPVQLNIALDVPQNPVTLSNSDEIPPRYLSSDYFQVAWSFDGQDPRVAAAGTTGAFAGAFGGATFDYGLDKWGDAESLPIKVVAESLESGILADSELMSTEITIDRIQLEKPLSDLDPNGAYTANQQITFTPVSSSGNLPVGWRIYYTTDGTDPGFTDGGEPERGSLYTGAFDLFSGTSSTANVNARVYGPAGKAHWFLPSPLYSASVTRWEVPTWHGYIGGDFANNSYSSFRNIKQHQTNGVLDTSFNPGSGLSDQGRALALQPDGKVIVAGDFTSVDGVTRGRIARLNTDGSLDTSFDPGNGFDDEVVAVALQSDGKILVGGKFRKFQNHWRKGYCRLNADGSLDWSYNVGQAVHSDDDGWVHSIAIQPDGKAIVGGCFSRYDYNSAYSLARVNTNGSYDGSFDTTPGVNGYLHVVKLQGDGKILIGGSFSRYDNKSRSNLARVLPNGRNDDSFDVGRGPNKDVYTISLFPDGKIFIGGNFSDVDKKKRQGVARILVDGSVDPSYQIEFTQGQGQAVPSWIVYGSDIESTGRVIVGGNLRAYNPQSGARGAFVRLDANGAIDHSYNPEDLPQHSYVYAVAVRPDNRAIVTGKFPEIFNSTGGNLAKLDTATGALDTSFDVGSGADEPVHSVLSLSGGDVLAGGEFEDVDGSTRERFARLGADGTLRALSLDIDTGAVHALAEDADGKILLGGDFDDVNNDSNYRGLARLDADGNLDTGFVLPGTTESVWVQTHSWKWWIGYWQTVSTSGFNGRVHCILPLEDGGYLVGGDFTEYGGSAQTGLALINSDGSLNPLVSAANGNAPGSGGVRSIIVLPNDKIIYAGDFAGQVACLNSDLSPDGSFSPASINGAVESVAIQEDGRLLVGGSFTTVSGSNRKRVASLNPDGSLYAGFDPGNGANGDVHQVVALPGGKAVLLGEFSSYDGAPRKGTACVNPDGSLDDAFVNPSLTVNSINTTD